MWRVCGVLRVGCSGGTCRRRHACAPANSPGSQLTAPVLQLLFKLLNGQPLEGSSAQSAGGGDSDSAASSPPAAPRNGTIV